MTDDAESEPDAAASNEAASEPNAAASDPDAASSEPDAAKSETDGLEADSDADTADTMRGRAGASRLKLWLLLRANRLVVAGVLTVGIFIAFVTVASVLSPSLAAKAASGDPIETLFAATITAIVTGATLVVTIGQVVLTQENGPLGDQHDRMTGSMDVRESIAALTGSPAPADPAAFLAAILAAASGRASSVRESSHDRAADGSVETGFRSDVDAFASSVVKNADDVRGQLEGAQFGSFDVVFAALNFDYGRKLAGVEDIVDEHGEQLTDHERGQLDELQKSLALFASAREHVKTLYFQWVLIDLSRQILYAAVPALVIAGVMVTVVDVGTFPGQTLGVDNLTLAVGGAFAVTLLPFSLFVSYVLRVLTLAKRTLAIEPLVLRDET